MATAFSKLGARISEPPISWLMKMTLDHPRLVSLAAGFTDSDALPVRETNRIFKSILRQSNRAKSALQYGSTSGDERLRQLTADRLRLLDTGQESAALDSVYSSERMLISNGSQQLLYMLTEALCDAGDIVLVEDPTYFVYLGIAQSMGLKCRGIRLEDDGLNISDLDRQLDRIKRRGDLSRVKMLYLVSYFQNPTGTTTSFAKKTAILELLKCYERRAGHPIYLLEDAAYRELRFSGEDTPSALVSFSDRVVYTGTYSKPFTSGARVGFGLLPKELFQIVRRIKGNHDFGTSNLLQQLLAESLADGSYEKHLPKMRHRYARKECVMAKAIATYFPDLVRWQRALGGLYIWASLPPDVRTGPKSPLFQAALRKEVLYVPGEFCYASDPRRKKPSHEMRLSFGGARLDDITLGIRRLGQVIRKQIEG